MIGVNHRKQRESPDAFDRPGFAALLASLRCLRQPGRTERVAPFSPTRLGWFDSLYGRD